ncbi:MAG: hypothetical protein HQL82_03215 [Magnetococcales bacterium]|nr:hypothetical protein [Magnetococcales bacterium]
MTDTTFKSTHAFQAIVGAAAHPERRQALLEKVGQGLRRNPGLSAEDFRAGVQKAIEVGAISAEEGTRYFTGHLPP